MPIPTTPVSAAALGRYIRRQSFDVSEWYADLSAHERIAPGPFS